MTQCRACSRPDGSSFKGTRVSVGQDQVCSNCFYSFRIHVVREARNRIFKKDGPNSSLLMVDWSNPETTVAWDQWLEERGRPKK